MVSHVVCFCAIRRLRARCARRPTGWRSSSSLPGVVFHCNVGFACLSPIISNVNCAIPSSLSERTHCATAPLISCQCVQGLLLGSDRSGAPTVNATQVILECSVELEIAFLIETTHSPIAGSGAPSIFISACIRNKISTRVRSVTHIIERVLLLRAVGKRYDQRCVPNVRDIDVRSFLSHTHLHRCFKFV